MLLDEKAFTILATMMKTHDLVVVTLSIKKKRGAHRKQTQENCTRGDCNQPAAEISIASDTQEALLAHNYRRL